MTGRSAQRPPRRRGGQARRTGRPVRQRVRGRLPSIARVTALLVFAGLVAGTVTLVNGPWLRVAGVTADGGRYTPAEAIDGLLSPLAGTPILGLDSDSLEERLLGLPAVATASVSVELPDRIRVTIGEKQPALTWLTVRARLVLAADGTVIGELARDAELPDDLIDLPALDDQRVASRRMVVGDAVPLAELRAAERLLALDPTLLGSSAPWFDLRIDDEYGFVLVARRPAWRAAMGFYQAAPGESEATAIARLEAQVAAVRTLFAAHPEATVTWVDARNPGKVYWAP